MTEPASFENAERRAATTVTVAVGLLVAEQVAARATRDALFLAAYQVRSLPYMMAVSALLALVSAELLSSALARRAPSRVVPATALASAALLALLWPLAALAPRLAAVVVYLHVAAFGGALVSGFWSCVNERFDPYTARRVVGRIGTGAAAGGVAGGALGWSAALLLPLPAVLFVLAALHAGAGLVLMRARRPAGGAAAQEVAAATAAAPAPAALALTALAGTPYLRQLAAVVTVGAVVEALVDWSFKAQVQARYQQGGGSALLAPLSAFYLVMAVASLLLQSTLARAALQRFGIAGTVALRPLLTALGSLLGAVAPRLDTATIARGAHESLTNSLFRSGYELLYTPVPETEKRRTKAVIDLALDKLGAFLGSGLILAVLHLLPRSAPRALFALAVLLSLLAAVLSRRLHRGYVRALEHSLLLGRVRLDPGQAVDRATQLTIAHTRTIERGALLSQIEELRRSQDLAPSAPGSRSPAEEADAGDRGRTPLPPDPLLEALHDLRSGGAAAVRRALEAHPVPPPALVAGLVPLLARDDCFAEVLAALRRAAPRVTGQLVDAMLDPGSEPAVRRRVARVLKACPTPRAVQGLLAALEQPSFELRAAAAAALAALNERDGVVRVERAQVLDRVRREFDSGEPVDRQLPLVLSLLSLTLEREPLRIAWAAVRGGDPRLRGTALEYLSNVLPEDMFPRLRSLFGASALGPSPRWRPVEQLAAELRDSSVGLALEQPPWQEGGEGEEPGPSSGPQSSGPQSPGS